MLKKRAAKHIRPLYNPFRADVHNGVLRLTNRENDRRQTNSLAIAGAILAKCRRNSDRENHKNQGNTPKKHLIS